MIQNRSPLYESEEVEILCPHETQHTDAYSSFIHNYQNLEGARMTWETLEIVKDQ